MLFNLVFCIDKMTGLLFNETVFTCQKVSKYSNIYLLITIILFSNECGQNALTKTVHARRTIYRINH